MSRPGFKLDGDRERDLFKRKGGGGEKERLKGFRVCHNFYFKRVKKVISCAYATNPTRRRHMHPESAGKKSLRQGFQ